MRLIMISNGNSAINLLTALVFRDQELQVTPTDCLNCTKNGNISRDAGYWIFGR